MKKQSKILLAALIGLIVVGVAAFAAKPGLFQGKLSRCASKLENFDPNPNSIGKYGDELDFKWNGPGCSNYRWTQYRLCFENVNNNKEFTCIGFSDSNHRKLSIKDWELIDGSMETLTSPDKVETYWYIISDFGNALKGEQIISKPWKFTYSKFHLKTL